jgi:hypothetical protein
MDDIKTILQSRTVWANTIGLAALGAAFLGVPLEADDQRKLVESCLQIVAGGGFVASTIFRIVATKRIGRR